MNKEIIKRIKEIIIECNDLRINVKDIDDDNPLFSEPISMDSVASLLVLEAIENEYDIEVKDQELTPDIFQSVKSLSSFIEKKLTHV